MQAEIGVQRVGQLPRHHIARKPVKNGYKIHKSLLHTDIRDVTRKHLQGVVNRQSPQKIGIDLVFLSRLAGLRRRANGPQAHLLHQPFHPLVVDGISPPLQIDRHFWATVEGVTGVFFIDLTHQRQIQRGFSGRCIIEGTSMQVDQVALPTNAQLGMVDFDHRLSAFKRKGQIFFQPLQFHLKSPDLLVELSFPRLLRFLLAGQRLPIEDIRSTF